VFLLDLAIHLSEWVLRAMPKRWQRVLEPDSTLGVAIGLLLALAVIAMIVAIVAHFR
jgi:hypothetical protein